MQLVLIRHGVAEERSPDGTDAERALTPEGRRRFRQAARGLAAVLPPPDAVLTSPLRRARQTAEIAAKAWGLSGVEEAEPLADGSFEGLEEILEARPAGCTLALVGHEPHMSQLLARFLRTSHDERVAFKKGAAALVDLPGRPVDGGTLVWFLPPRILRELGG